LIVAVLPQIFVLAGLVPAIHAAGPRIKSGVGPAVTEVGLNPFDANLL
jgi:hypothetical protein